MNVFCRAQGEPVVDCAHPEERVNLRAQVVLWAKLQRLIPYHSKHAAAIGLSGSPIEYAKQGLWPRTDGFQAQGRPEKLVNAG